MIWSWSIEITQFIPWKQNLDFWQNMAQKKRTGEVFYPREKISTEEKKNPAHEKKSWPMRKNLGPQKKYLTQKKKLSTHEKKIDSQEKEIQPTSNPPTRTRTHENVRLTRPTRKQDPQYLADSFLFTSWKVSVLGVFLVRIFPRSDWIRRDTPYLSVLSPNEGKYGPEKLRIWTRFPQWLIHNF